MPGAAWGEQGWCTFWQILHQVSLHSPAICPFSQFLSNIWQFYVEKVGATVPDAILSVTVKLKWLFRSWNTSRNKWTHVMIIVFTLDHGYIQNWCASGFHTIGSLVFSKYVNNLCDNLSNAVFHFIQITQLSIEQSLQLCKPLNSCSLPLMLCSPIWFRLSWC